MGNDLRSRLRRIREAGSRAGREAGQGTGRCAGQGAGEGAGPDTAAGETTGGEGRGAALPPRPETDRPPASFGPEWEAAGFGTLKRDLCLDLPRPFPPGPVRGPPGDMLRSSPVPPGTLSGDPPGTLSGDPPGGVSEVLPGDISEVPPGIHSGAMPRDLCLLIPDLFRYAAGGRGPPGLEDLLFFDLETTGLSGGAGTVAFLAAFGRFVPAGTETGGAGCCGAGPGGTGTGGKRGRFRLRVTQYLLLDYPGECDFLQALLPEWGPRGDGRVPLTVTYNGKSFDSQIVRTRCLMNGFEPPVFYHADLLHPCRRLWKRVLPNCSQAAVETLILGLDREGDTPGALAPDIWFFFLRSGDPLALSGICDHNVKDIAGLAVLFLALADIAERPLEAEETRRCDAEQLALCWRRAEPWGFPLLRRAAERGGPRACRQLSIEAEWRRGNYGEALAWAEKGLAAADLRESLKADLERRRGRLAARLRQAGSLHEEPDPQGEE